MERYGKRAGLIVHSDEPYNAETDPAALAEGALTATDAFYVRGHGAVPEIDPGAWRLRVHGLVERELDLSLATLREAFREREVTATLQCAGNRRAGLMAIRAIPGEAPWGPGATGTATWSGVALADVLALAVPGGDAAFVGFEGADVCREAEPVQRFGGSIGLEKACRSEVLLAWAMNGEPLAPVHGAPLRVVVPGYIGARSVKWLERIEISAVPWRGYFQEVVYRLLPEDGAPGPGKGWRSAWSRSTPTFSSRPTAQQSPPARSRSAATRSRAASAMSPGSTSRSTAARAGARRTFWTTSVPGRGGSGAQRSTWRPASTRSSSAPGTRQPPPNRRTRPGFGTRRATSTMPGRGCASAPSSRPATCGHRCVGWERRRKAATRSRFWQVTEQ